MTPVRDVDSPPSPHPRPQPKPGIARRVVMRTWWMPWLLGSAVLAAGTVTVIQVAAGPQAPKDWEDVQLPSSTHEVVYEVAGKGTSPEIKFVVDGIAATETLTDVELPWSKEFTLEVGPGLGVVQVMASNTGEADSISCAVRVDGNVVHQASAPGEFSAVSCSSVIRP
ncbi:membrane protein [Saccharomonospora marina XMU15]|uniref:Membrane protein n=1 Tax=Saccharomonospora marina XMU15 TaxID=882083 RepID=H5X902_9PSEU|nr:MmpS family transport accessory protein [Saccharomonospora marina]EHR53605.1 membrane protein [Saccharomonospora marina XMU15]